MSGDMNEGMPSFESVVQSGLIDGGWCEVALSLGVHVYELWFEATQKPYDGKHFIARWRYLGEGVWREDHPPFGGPGTVMDLLWSRTVSGKDLWGSRA